MAGHGRGVVHVGFTVGELQRSTDFYTALGFTLDSVTRANGPDAATGTGVAGAEQDIALLSYDGLVLELVQYSVPGVARPPRNNDVGSAHVSIAVTGLRELHRKLSAEGLEFYSEPLRFQDAVDWCYLRDPDGITVELAEDLTA